MGSNSEKKQCTKPTQKIKQIAITFEIAKLDLRELNGKQ